MKLLMTCFDYRPRLGGVATVGYELARALAARPDVELRLLAPEMIGAREADAAGGPAVERIALPDQAALAVPRFAAALGAKMVSWRPDAVINLLWLPGGVASLLNAPVRRALGGVPYYSFAHAVELLESDRTPRKRARAALSPLKRSVFHNAEGVFAVSRFAKSLVVNYCGADPERVHVVPNGVDPLRFRPAAPAPDLVERHGLRGKKVFLTVSRLVDYKGVDRAIAAFRLVAKDHPEARYLICGEGEDLARLRALARHYRVQEQVIFAGAPSFERLRDYYALADAFVLLPRADWEAPQVEGFGVVYLEAAACGKPSIAGASGGVPDAVEGGRTGWLVDPLDDRAISAAMREAIERPELARALGEAARERVLRELTWSHMAARVTEIIGRARVRD